MPGRYASALLIALAAAACGGDAHSESRTVVVQAESPDPYGAAATDTRAQPFMARAPLVDDGDAAGPPASPLLAAEGCDPNYTPCVPVASDVDCEGGRGNGPAYVRGPVRVVRRDIYRLDHDRDGIGCDR